MVPTWWIPASTPDAVTGLAPCCPDMLRQDVVCFIPLSHFRMSGLRGRTSLTSAARLGRERSFLMKPSAQRRNLRRVLYPQLDLQMSGCATTDAALTGAFALLFPIRVQDPGSQKGLSNRE